MTTALNAQSEKEATLGLAHMLVWRQQAGGVEWSGLNSLVVLPGDLSECSCLDSKMTQIKQVG
jgi:hypothetical protein